MRKYHSTVFTKTRNAPTDEDLVNKLNGFYEYMSNTFKDGWKIEAINYSADGSAILITTSHEVTTL